MRTGTKRRNPRSHNRRQDQGIQYGRPNNWASQRNERSYWDRQDSYDDYRGSANTEDSPRRSRGYQNPEYNDQNFWHAQDRSRNRGRSWNHNYNSSGNNNWRRNYSSIEYGPDSNAYGHRDNNREYYYRNNKNYNNYDEEGYPGRNSRDYEDNFSDDNYYRTSNNYENNVRNGRGNNYRNPGYRDDSLYYNSSNDSDRDRRNYRSNNYFDDDYERNYRKGNSERSDNYSRRDLRNDNNYQYNYYESYPSYGQSALHNDDERSYAERQGSGSRRRTDWVNFYKGNENDTGRWRGNGDNEQNHRRRERPNIRDSRY